MKKRYKTIISIVIGTMLVGCSYGTTSSDSLINEEEEAITATLKIWAPEKELEEESWLNQQLSAFQKEHPKWDLTFEKEAVDINDVANVASNALETVADVYMYANSQIPSLLNNQILAEIGGDTYEEIKATNHAVMVDSVSYDGGLYGVPSSADTWFLYYNTDDFTTKDIQNLDTMLEEERVALPLSDPMFLEAFYIGNGCSVFGIDGTSLNANVDFSGDKAYAVTNYLMDLADDRHFVDVSSIDTAISQLENGRVSALIAKADAYNEVQNALGEDNFGIASLPTYTLGDEDIQLKAFVSSEAFGINPNSENLTVAIALAKYLGSKSAQIERYEIEGIVPIYIDDTEDEEDMHVRAQKNTLAKASIMQPFQLGTINYYASMEFMGNELVEGAVTEENSVEKTDALQANMSSVIQ